MSPWLALNSMKFPLTLSSLDLIFCTGQLKATPALQKNIETIYFRHCVQAKTFIVLARLFCGRFVMVIETVHPVAPLKAREPEVLLAQQFTLGIVTEISTNLIDRVQKGCLQSLDEIKRQLLNSIYKVFCKFTNI